MEYQRADRRPLTAAIQFSPGGILWSSVGGRVLLELSIFPKKEASG